MQPKDPRKERAGAEFFHELTFRLFFLTGREKFFNRLPVVAAENTFIESARATRRQDTVAIKRTSGTERLVGRLDPYKILASLRYTSKP
jgi:hypothetical protein